MLTRNIRKPGDVGNLNFCTFTKICNGLIGWSFEFPASAYCHPLVAIKKNEKKMRNLEKTKMIIGYTLIGFSIVGMIWLINKQLFQNNIWILVNI